MRNPSDLHSIDVKDTPLGDLQLDVTLEIQHLQLDFTLNLQTEQPVRTLGTWVFKAMQQGQNIRADEDSFMISH
jgi:hypothetical protein